MKFRFDREEGIQKYSGQPNKQDEKESSIWKKFLKVIFPWVSRKWELGNAYLEARVEKEKNEAEKLKAETTLLKIQAQKEIEEIIDTATKEDEVTAVELEVKKEATAAELDTDLKELQEKIKLMYLKYGMKISVSVDNGEVTKQLPEEREESISEKVETMIWKDLGKEAPKQEDSE